MIFTSTSTSNARPRFAVLTVVRARAVDLVDRQPWWSSPQTWLIALTVLGLALRTYHFLSNPPVWHDEAALIINVLYKNSSEILGPLFYSEACPPLFLAVQQLIVLGLGDTTFALRLLPWLASCVSLIGLILLAKRLLPPTALLWFALLLACSDRLLFHACEAKPYAVDVLVATGILALLLAKPKVPANAAGHCGRLLCILAVLSPVLVFLSFPACFMLGGAALTLAPDVWRHRSRRIFFLYGLFGCLLCGSFLALYCTAIRAQKNDNMLSCWIVNLPCWDKPWLVAPLAVVRLSEVFRYAAVPIGNLLVILAVVGGVYWWQQGQRRRLALLLWPLVLNLAAWLVSSYPLGAQRVCVYAAPAALLLVAAGIPPALAWLGRFGKMARLAGVLLLLIPVGETAKTILVWPWQRTDSATPAAFVLANRRADEPVVGTQWEHTYYFHALGGLCRELALAADGPPLLPSAVALDTQGRPTGGSAKSLWLLGGNTPAEHAAYLVQLRPAANWRIEAIHQARDFTVLHLIRD
jgi:hypothetical protein